jgi:hypothetical protein
VSQEVVELLREAYEHQEGSQHKITGYFNPIDPGWVYGIELLCSECDFRGVFEIQSNMSPKGRVKLERLLGMDSRLGSLVRDSGLRILGRFDRILRAHPRGF